MLVVSPTLREPRNLTVDGMLVTAARHTRPGTASQVISIGSPGASLATSGSSTKARTTHVSQIGHLQQKISGRDEAALLGGQRVHDARKRSADIRFCEHVLRGIVGRLRFGLLRCDAR